MKKISKNFLALFISDAASHIIGFLATIYLARILATEGFGLISYGMAFFSYALLFANPGLTTIGTREVAKDYSNRRIIEEILGLRLCLAVIVFFLFIIGLLAIPGPLITKRIIFLYLLSVFPFAHFLEFVFQGREEMEYIGIARFCQYGVYLILLFVLLKNNRGILTVPTSFFFGYFAATVLLLFICINKYHALKYRFSMSFWRNLLVASIPVGLATIFSQVYLSLPPIILGVFHSKTDVGLFSASFKIVVTLLIIDRVFYYTFFPVITKQFINAPERLESSFNFIVRLLFAITIPLTVGGIILADRLIYFIYGNAYGGAISIFRILLFYFLVAPINTILGYGLVSINQERRFFRVIAMTAAVSLILIIILGIIFKGTGAAIALLIGEMVSIILMNRELKKSVKFETSKYLLKPILISLIMGAVLYVFSRGHIILLIVLGNFLYITGLFLIKGFSREEFKNLLQTFTQK